MNPSDPQPRQGARPRLILAAVAALALAGAFGARQFMSPAQATSAAQPTAAVGSAHNAVVVTTALVALGSVPQTTRGLGTVVPIASVTVKARVDGQLESVDFVEGQDVKAGQVLARIDARAYQAQVAEIVAQRAKDAALLANARADLGRYTELIKEDATTRQTLDTQRALVAQLEATLATDDAQIQYAKVQLAYTTIQAPISGRIGARLVDPGNIVHAADTTGLLVINQIDPIAVQFTVSESAYRDLSQAVGGSAQPLPVDVLGRSDGEVLGRGRLTLLNNQIDVSTGTLMLKGHVPNPDHRLWPGQSVYGEVTLAPRPDALTVPTAAIQRSQDGLFVYVVGADQTVQVRPVQVADANAGRTVVVGGLKADERIVVDGQFKLTPGAHVVEDQAGART